jgi:putative transposase
VSPLAHHGGPNQDEHSAASKAHSRAELTANALRDPCRFSAAGVAYIEPGSPWENPFIESFNGKLRDELLNVEAFETRLEARLLA